MSILKINILPIMVIYFVCQTVKASEDASGCAEFTFDKCEEEGLIEKLDEVEDQPSCQTLCHLFADSENCKSYLYNAEQKKCQIYRTDMITYFQTCKQVAGPKDPNPQKCIEADDPCKNFLRESCQYSGDVLEFFEATDVDMCQQLCAITAKCNYFILDKETSECKLMNTNSEPNCDAALGPLSPNYADVEEECGW